MKAFIAIGRSIRLLLILVAVGIVVWSFCFVGTAWWRQRQDRNALTLLYWFNDEYDDNVTRASAQEFQKEHPGIGVRFIPVQYGEYIAKLRTMCAAGEPPDLFLVPQGWFVSLASLNLLHPLDEYVAEERRTGRAQWLDDIYPLLMSCFKYDGQTVGKGSLLGIPKDFTTVVMWVNVDLFKRAGVPIPYGGWTWTQYESAMRKITALSTPERPIYGGTLELGADSLRNILWTYGADFFAVHDGVADFNSVAMNQPANLRALEMIRRVRLQDRTVYNPSGVAKDTSYQLFLAGDIGTLGPIGRWKTTQFRQIRNFTVDCVPIPYETEPASQLYTTSWSMATSCKHPDEAFALIRSLCGPAGSSQLARLGMSIPALHSIADTDVFLSPGQVPLNTQLFLDQMKVARVGQLPKQNTIWEQLVDNDVIERCLQLGTVTPRQAADELTQDWSRALASPLEQEFPPMPWKWITVVAVLALAGALGAFVGGMRRRNAGVLERRVHRAGWLFISPWLLGFLLLTLGPVLVSLLLSFAKWTAMTPVSSAQFLGMENFHQLLFHDADFSKSLRVTLWFAILAVPTGQVLALLLALLLNNRLQSIGLFRTVFFLPSVVSGVALATLWLWIFNTNYGLLNAFLRPVANVFHAALPDWFGADAHRWAIPAFVLIGLWGVGGGMIIYLAGLKAIPASLYEAARIDGAGASSRFWNVTLPMLSPFLFFNSVMAVIGSFQIFTQARVMTNGGPDNATLFYVLNLYRQAFEFQNMGYASAMAWILLLLLLGLTLLIFRASRNWVYYEGLAA